MDRVKARLEQTGDACHAALSCGDPRRVVPRQPHGVATARIPTGIYNPCLAQDSIHAPCAGTCPDDMLPICKNAGQLERLPVALPLPAGSVCHTRHFAIPLCCHRPIADVWRIGLTDCCAAPCVGSSVRQSPWPSLRSARGLDCSAGLPLQPGYQACLRVTGQMAASIQPQPDYLLSVGPAIDGRTVWDGRCRRTDSGTRRQQ